MMLVAIALLSAPASAQERPVVFVHGIASSGSSWRDAADRLQARSPCAPRRLTSVPAPSMKCRPINWSARAGAVGNDVVVIGHSNGGIVARQWSQIRPVSALVTVGTPHRGAPIVPNLASYARVNLRFSLPSAMCIARSAARCCNVAVASDQLFALVEPGVRPGVELDPADRRVAGLDGGAAGAAGDGAWIRRICQGSTRRRTWCARAQRCPHGSASSRPRTISIGAGRCVRRFQTTAMPSRIGETSPGWVWTTPRLTCWLNADYGRLVGIRDRRHVVECVVFSVRDG